MGTGPTPHHQALQSLANPGGVEAIMGEKSNSPELREITACVVSYHKSKYTLVLHVDGKLQTYSVKPSVVAALSSGAAHALGNHVLEVENDRNIERDRERNKTDAVWPYRARPKVDTFRGELETPATSSVYAREHASYVR